MSRQMIHLGRPDDALELIHLAQYGSRDCATPRTQAMLYAMEARAYANMGQPSKCKRAVRMAEDTFADAGPTASRSPTGSASSPRPSSTARTPTPTATSPMSRAAAPPTPRSPSR